MRMPSFKKLATETERSGFHWKFCGASHRHPNPRFYKYYWWIFWQESPCDGWAFKTKPYRLATQQAFDLIQRLQAEKQSYWIYNTRLPRLDPANPFNPKAEVWRDAEWAPAFDEDTDAEHEGFK